MTIDSIHGASHFLPPLPPREPGRAVETESFARTLGKAVNDYNSHLDSMAKQWVNLTAEEAPSMAQFIELRQTMHHASFYEHVARQLETKFGDLVTNLVVRA